MIEIKNYIKLSKIAESIIDNFTNSKNFKDNYRLVSDNERKAFLRHFIINNVPYAFKSKPLLYEQITQYLSDMLGLSTNEIKLIGSAKTGFSISPPPNY